MSEQSKRNIRNINSYLLSARESINSAAITAEAVKDKVLADKIAAAAASVKDTSDYIKSRTGEES